MPYIVRQCIEEVEKRGIDEVGIYRISGVATDIQALKSVFDTSKNRLVASLLHSAPQPVLTTGATSLLRIDIYPYKNVKTHNIDQNLIYDCIKVRWQSR